MVMFCATKNSRQITDVLTSNLQQHVIVAFTGAELRA